MVKVDQSTYSLISRCINRSIDLYEKYTQRQTVGEVHGRTDLAWGQEYAQTSQTQTLPRASSLGASWVGGEANIAQPTYPPAPNSASAISPLKNQPLSATILGPNPSPNPAKPTLMPEYNFVHNHYSRITGDLEADDSTIMQSYDYGPLDIGPAIGFQVPTIHQRIRAPPRKVTVLETLPPLSPEVVAEVTHPVKVREQAELLAAIREAQEEVPKRQKKANRAKQTKVPPYLIHVPTPCIVEYFEAALSLKPQPTTLTRPKCTQLRIQCGQSLRRAGHHAGGVHKQVQVR